MASNEEDDSSLVEVQGSVDSVDYMSTYASALRERICREVNDTDYFRPLRSFKIVVDAGNGVGGSMPQKCLSLSVLMFRAANSLNLTYLPEPYTESGEQGRDGICLCGGRSP